MLSFNRSRWIYVSAVGAVGAAALCALSVRLLVAQPPEPPPGQSSSAAAASSIGGAGPTAGGAPAHSAGGQSRNFPEGNPFGVSGGGGEDPFAVSEGGGEDPFAAPTDGGESPFGAPTGGGEGSAAGQAHNPQRDYTILTNDEQGEQFSASRVFFYSLEPGAAKPKRLGININAGGYGGNIGMAMGMGMGGGYEGGGYEGGGYAGGGYGAGMGPMGSPGALLPGNAAAPDSNSWPTMVALVSDMSDAGAGASAKVARPTIKVGVSASGPAAPAAMPGMGGMPGYGGEGMMSSMGMGNESFLVAIETENPALIERLPGAIKTIAAAERANIAQLIRLDIWIEDARTALRTKRNDEKAFAATEANLKQLLGEEYDALLAKQRADAERLRKRLERLQADLERRAQAKDRVVDVQLGKLVLEAQGLLDTQR